MIVHLSDGPSIQLNYHLIVSIYNLHAGFGCVAQLHALNKQPTGYTSTHIFLASYGSYTLHGSGSGTGKMVMEPISPRSHSLSLCGVYSKCMHTFPVFVSDIESALVFDRVKAVVCVVMIIDTCNDVQQT